MTNKAARGRQDKKKMPDKIKARGRQDKKKMPDKIKACGRQYKKKMSDKIKARGRQDKKEMLKGKEEVKSFVIIERICNNRIRIM